MYVCLVVSLWFLLWFTFGFELLLAARRIDFTFGFELRTGERLVVSTLLLASSCYLHLVVSTPTFLLFLVFRRKRTGSGTGSLLAFELTVARGLR